MTLGKRISKWFKDTSKKLYIGGLGLKEWPQELKGKEHLILKLDCGNNQLESLSNFIVMTYRDDNQLKSLPNFPNLNELNCWNNQLKSLPNYPNLTELVCGWNQLKSLPKYTKLTFLECAWNQLTSLPNYLNLTFLSCHENQLFSDDINDWRKVWQIQKLRQSDLRKRGLVKVVKIMKLRLYLPRLTNLHQDLIYSPHHPGKFYKNLRQGDWSGEV